MKLQAFNGGLEPSSIKSILRKEKFYQPGNLRMLSDWLFTRDFLVKMLETQGDKFTVKGSSALPAYAETYRLPSDIDVSTENMAEVEDLIRHLVENDKDTDYKLVEEEPYCGSIRQKKVYAKQDGLSGKIGIDILRVKDRKHATQPGTLSPVLTLDGEPVQATVPNPHKIVGDKMNRILSVASLYDSVCATPKDFIDIYRISQTAGFDRKLAQDFLRENLLECDITLLDKTRGARDNLPMLVHPFLGGMYEKYTAKNVILPASKEEDVENYVVEFIREMEF
jgi:hypothetical protein